MKSSQASFYIALFVVFVDFLGYAICWPIFPSMLYDSSIPLLPYDTSSEMRGFFLGILLSLAPLTSFFSSPFWGALSDSRGRKRPLQLSLIFTCAGAIFSFLGAYFYHLWLILLSRIIVGFAAGNYSIVQATVADVSSPEEKTKNFGLFSTMIALGFTFGPLIGGTFSQFSQSVPFLVAAFLAVLNLVFALLFFQETLHFPVQTKINWKSGFKNLKRAFELDGLKTLFLVFFLSNFAWVFFVEFIPIYLMKNFHFSSSDLGIFFAVGSGAYAINSGILIRPLSKWLKTETLLIGSLFLAGVAILSILLQPSLIWMWCMLILMFSFCAYTSPCCSTIVSNSASPHIQGEALGIFGSVYSIATITSSLFSGSLIGAYPSLSIWGGGMILLAAAMIFFIFYPDIPLKKKIFPRL